MLCVLLHQAAMDRAFLTATAAPLLGLLAAVAYRLRPLEWQRRDGKQVPGALSLPCPACVCFPAVCALQRRGDGFRPACMQVFEDPDTGVVFETDADRAPEKDRRGELAFKAVSYTPWPVEQGAAGDRVRVAVGPVSACVPRTYVFPRLAIHCTCYSLPLVALLRAEDADACIRQPVAAGRGATLCALLQCM